MSTASCTTKAASARHISGRLTRDSQDVCYSRRRRQAAAGAVAEAEALALGTTPRAALAAGAAAGLGSRGLVLSESERTRAAEGVEVVEEDEVDEGLEEEDAMTRRFGLAFVWVLANRSCLLAVYISSLSLPAGCCSCPMCKRKLMKSKMKKKKIEMGHAARTRPSARSSSIGVDQLGTLEDGSRRSHNVFCSVHV